MIIPIFNNRSGYSGWNNNDIINAVAGVITIPNGFSIPTFSTNAGYKGLNTTQFIELLAGTLSLKNNEFIPIIKNCGGVKGISQNELDVILASLNTVYFEDLFEDVVGTLLSNHTPNIDVSGNGWQNEAVDFQINDNTGGGAGDSITGTSNRQITLDTTGEEYINEFSLSLDYISGNARFQHFFRMNSALATNNVPRIFIGVRTGNNRYISVVASDNVVINEIPLNADFTSGTIDFILTNDANGAELICVNTGETLSVTNAELITGITNNTFVGLDYLYFSGNGFTLNNFKSSSI